MRTCLIYCIDEGLGIISREVFDHLDLIGVREDGRYQTNTLVYGKGISDQPFPSGNVTTREDTVKLTDGISPEQTRN